MHRLLSLPVSLWDPSFLFWLLVLSSSRTCALQNITMDDGGRLISYMGNWELRQSPLDYGGALRVTQDKNATATFTFSGIGVYFMSPLWPYAINTLITLDSGPPVLVDLTDHSQTNNSGQGLETVPSQVVWGATNLANEEHKVVISVGQNQTFATVDALIYTTFDGADPPSSSGPTSTAPAAVSSSAPFTSSSQGTSRKAIAIAVGCICTSIGIGLFAALFMYCRRRRRLQKEARVASWIAGPPYLPSPTKSPPAPPTPAPMTSSPHPGTVPDSGAYTTYPQQAYFHWQSGPPPPLQYHYTHTHPRYTAYTLSTITEASQSPYGAASSLMHSPQSFHSPASLQAEFGHQPGERLSFIAENGRHTSPQYGHGGASDTKDASYGQQEKSLPKPPAYRPRH